MTLQSFFIPFKSVLGHDQFFVSSDKSNFFKSLVNQVVGGFKSCLDVVVVDEGDEGRGGLSENEEGKLVLDCQLNQRIIRLGIKENQAVHSPSMDHL